MVVPQILLEKDEQAKSPNKFLEWKVDEASVGLIRKKYVTNKYFMLQRLDNPRDGEVFIKQLFHYFDISVARIWRLLIAYATLGAIKYEILYSHCVDLFHTSSI